MLASGQGGSDGAHAPALNSQKGRDAGKMATFIDKGEAILKTMTATLTELSQHSRKLNTVVQTVEQLQADVNSLKRKSPADDGAGPSCSKRPSMDVDAASAMSDSDSDTDRRADDPDVDTLFEPEHRQEEREDDFLGDIEQFFEERTITGEKVSEKVARVAEASLRGSLDDEKFKQLREKYRRPENVDNLQTPVVDSFIWKGLDRQTRARDVQIQKASAQLSQCLVPVIRTLDLLQSPGELEKGRLKELVTDTFKVIVSSITSNIKVRRDFMLKEMLPAVRGQCAKTVPSATSIFGDKIKEDIKTLNEKGIQITPAKPFLSSGGGVRTQGTYQQRNASPLDRTSFKRVQHHHMGQTNSQQHRYRKQQQKQPWQQKQGFNKRDNRHK